MYMILCCALHLCGKVGKNIFKVQISKQTQYTVVNELPNRTVLEATLYSVASITVNFSN